ncbi:MAG: VWA domain-containing protein [Acidobacteria bacterium]|nr:VWA domain-containing protein [Acidobacteriota bacterium]
MAALLGNVLVFGRLLRTLGMEVHVGRLLDVAEALQQVNLGAREDVYHACRALLVHRRDDLAVFDRAFDAFWREHDALSNEAPRRPGDERRGADRGAGEPASLERAGMALDQVGAEASAEVLQTWSDAQSLTRKDFAEYTPDEILMARAAMARLEWAPDERRTRRWVRGHGPRMDLRRALAHSVRTGGDIFTLPSRRRRMRERPIVLLCDVSGSMERYSRMLLHFAHALGRRRRRVEVFVFSTTLTRVTNEIGTRRLNDAAADVSRSAPHWSGGTRIGVALRQFHQQWARRALRGGPVVLLISDGWDRGDPLMLREQIKRLQRSCHRLIWLNPLIGSLDYAPLTRGLQAALPFVDDFLPARTLSNLAELALHLNTLPARTHSHGHRRFVHV